MPKDSKTKRRDWTDEEEQYVLDHYREKTLKEIAIDLGRTEGSVYTKSKQLRLNILRPWLPKEEFYLEAKLRSSKVEDIAKQIFRTPVAVYCKISKMGLRISDPFEPTVYQLSKIIGIDPSMLYRSIKAGLLQTDGRSSYHNSHRIHESYLREYVMKYHPKKWFTCCLSGLPVMGDIYHPSALPEGEKKKKEFPNIYRLNPHSPVFSSELIAALREIRPQTRLKQEDISLALNYHKQWYTLYENGRPQAIEVDTLSKVVDLLGFKMTILLEKK